MPSPTQLRAARAMLDLSAVALAKLAGINRESVLRAEKDSKDKKHRPTADTIERLLDVFHDADIDFIGETGVVRKDEELIRFSGSDAYLKVLDDVASTLRRFKQREALFACVSDKLSPPVVVDNYRRLRKEGITMRSLVREGDDYFMGRLDEYRVLPSSFFHNNPIVIYGNRVAFMILSPDTGVDCMAVVMKNIHCAVAMRNLFDFIWSQCSTPSKTSAKERYDE